MMDIVSAFLEVAMQLVLNFVFKLLGFSEDEAKKNIRSSIYILLVLIVVGLIYLVFKIAK
jgi:hypothetical protein